MTHACYGPAANDNRLCPSPAEPFPQNKYPRVSAPLALALCFPQDPQTTSPCNLELTFPLQTDYLLRIALRGVNLRLSGVLRNRSLHVNFQADLALNFNGGTNAIILGVYLRSRP